MSHLTVAIKAAGEGWGEWGYVGWLRVEPRVRQDVGGWLAGYARKKPVLGGFCGWVGWWEGGMRSRVEGVRKEACVGVGAKSWARKLVKSGGG